MADMQLNWSVNVGGVSRTARVTVTAEDPANVNVGPVVVANGQTDKALSIGGIDVSQLKGVFIVSDKDVLVEFNDNAGAGGSLNLAANVPYIWHADDVNALLITADVTAVYVTNASGAAANLYFFFLQDTTV